MSIIVKPLFLRGPLMSGTEPGTDLPLADKLVASAMFNAGWILLLVGFEPIGQLVISGTPIYSYWGDAFVMTLGAAFFIGSYLWPPSKPEHREFLHRLFDPFVRRRVTLGLILLSVLWGSVQWQVWSVKSDLNTYVLPRVITSAQGAHIREFLKNNGSGNVLVKYTDGSRETTEYAYEILESINGNGKWTASISVEKEGIGDGLDISDAGSNIATTQDKDNVKILRDAFAAAGVQAGA